MPLSLQDELAVSSKQIHSMATGRERGMCSQWALKSLNWVEH